MRLSKVNIHNFRGIEKLSLELEDFTSLIGPNNTCKSTILHAIEYALNGQSPELEEWHNKQIDKPIEIEVEFVDLMDWERDRPGISSLVHDRKIHLKYIAIAENKTKEAQPKKVNVKYEAKIPEESIRGWAAKWRELSDEIRALAEKIGLDGKAFRTKANKERLREAIRQERPHLVTQGPLRFTDEGLSINAALQQALPQGILIPAVRDATDELKPTSKTAFGMLLNRILLPSIETTDEYHTVEKAIEGLRKKLDNLDSNCLPEVKTVIDGLTERLKALISAKAVLNLAEPDTRKLLGSSFTLRIDDGANTPVNLQGHGLQRALIYAMLEVLADQDANISLQKTEEENASELSTRPTESQDTSSYQKKRSTLLLFEEPELFMHPHLMRKLKETLKTVARKPEWQVAITTHSPFLIDVAENYRSLAILQRSNNCSPVVKQLVQSPFKGKKREKEILRASIDFHPSVCEVFFAEETILVEGPSEVAILKYRPQLFEMCNISKKEAAERTVISCGGKWAIPAIARLLKAFGIPFRVIHDLDKKDRSPEKIADTNADPYKANKQIALIVGDNKKIFVCQDTLEDVLWEAGDSRTPHSSHDKPYRAWKRVNEIESDPELFKKHPTLKKLIQFAFSSNGDFSN